MYLAPLNYDRFFKKIFSDVTIAKRFLEDFFEKPIEDIKLLPTNYKLTDAAAMVRFDFRCKMDGEHVIIDMQQWYKSDIIPRFYAYHCSNTVLQLEKKDKKQKDETDEETNIFLKELTLYQKITPVITLIWMVHDRLGFKDDYVIFKHLPHQLADFVQNPHWWEKDNYEKMVKHRQHLNKILNNKTKNIDFLAKNQLIYVFQPNVVRNKPNKKYRPWFEFAQKTSDENNKESDFTDFQEDKIFREVTHRLSKEAAQEENYSYMRYYTEFKSKAERFKAEGKEEGRLEGRMEGKMEGKYEVAKNCLLNGISIAQTVMLTGLNKAEVQQIQKEIQ